MTEHQTLLPHSTLSQTALALRLGRPASWIRARGIYVTAMANSGNMETYRRLEYANGRCAGYSFLRAAEGASLKA